MTTPDPDDEIVGSFATADEAVAFLRRDTSVQASPDPLRQALNHADVLADYAYEQGFHELGYDPIATRYAGIREKTVAEVTPPDLEHNDQMAATPAQFSSGPSQEGAVGSAATHTADERNGGTELVHSEYVTETTQQILALKTAVGKADELLREALHSLEWLHDHYPTLNGYGVRWERMVAIRAYLDGSAHEVANR